MKHTYIRNIRYIFLILFLVVSGAPDSAKAFFNDSEHSSWLSGVPVLGELFDKDPVKPILLPVDSSGAYEPSSFFSLGSSTLLPGKLNQTLKSPLPPAQKYFKRDTKTSKLRKLWGKIKLKIDPRNLFYKSSYINSSIAARDSNGNIFGIVAGKHEKNFPYYHPKSEWDNVLIYVNNIGYALSDTDIAKLFVEHNGGSVRIAFKGELIGADGQARDLDIDLALKAREGKIYQLGKRFNVLDVDYIPGLKWQPSELTLVPGKSLVSVNGEKINLVSGKGEVEKGWLVNLKWKKFAFRYDYKAMADPDGSYSFVDFTTHALNPDTWMIKILDKYAQWSASEVLTMNGKTEEGNLFGVQAEAKVLVEDRVDLGLAWLDRQLVSSVDAQDRTLVGLREIFTAK
ncbi:hypothetical protein ACFL6Y_07330 [Elusimicrobiota bacterium]